MPKWEYKVLEYGVDLKGFITEEIEADLNLWGEEGWEAIAATRLQGEFVTLLKRPVGGSHRREPKDRWF